MTQGRRVARRSPLASASDTAAVAAGAAGSLASSTARTLSRLTVLCLVLAGLVVVTGWKGFADGDRAGLVSAPQVDLRTLPSSTTHARIPRAPRFVTDRVATAGEVVRPIRTVPVFAKPGRKPFAKVRPTTLSQTWLPVVARRAGYVRVLLPSRPNASAGWVFARDVESRRTPYAVRVHLGSRTLDLLYAGKKVGSWSVAIGAPGTPTPTGLTFVHALIRDPGQSYSPYLIPLGTHSDTLDTYGGGPGTVAFHTWPDASVFGQAVSHGCIRVPADALSRLTNLPLGTQVSIDNR
jgi:lipoprotein-anchoring transpeptidase ErfK/SrfK